LRSEKYEFETETSTNFCAAWTSNHRSESGSLVAVKQLT